MIVNEKYQHFAKLTQKFFHDSELMIFIAPKIDDKEEVEEEDVQTCESVQNNEESGCEQSSAYI
jgi:hypothetical protein